MIMTEEGKPFFFFREAHMQEIYTETYGQGKTILMVNGAISDCAIFRDAAEYLAEDYRVITFDKPGYGRTKMSGVSLCEEKDVILDLMERYQPFYLIAHSAGCIPACMALKESREIAGALFYEPFYPALVRSEKLNDMDRKVRRYLSMQAEEKAAEALFAVLPDDPGARPYGTEENRYFARNCHTFFACEYEEMMTALPEVCSGKAVTVGIGNLSIGSVAGRMADSVTEILQGKKAVFAGAHDAVYERPEAFAAKAKEILVR